MGELNGLILGENVSFRGERNVDEDCEDYFKEMEGVMTHL
jgi:hypothetical protein